MREQTATRPALRRSEQLSPEEQLAFENDGYVRLGRIVDDDELAALQRRIDQIMLGEVRYPGMMMQLDSDTGAYGDMPEQSVGFKGATLAYRKIQQLERDPVFLRFMQRPLYRDICQRFIGSDVSIFRSMFMNKPAHRGTLLPWHQDGGSNWGLCGGDPIVTLWLALDPATVANGCVQVIPGSHRLGLLSERGHTITPEQEAEHCRPERIVHIELEPGEVVLLHNWLLHRSDRNATDTPRRAFSLCLMDAAIGKADDPDARFPKLFGSEVDAGG